jgi:hypothetical protein
MKFSSRADFAAHLAEHQRIKIWVCTTCGHQSHDRHSLEQHAMRSHQFTGEEDCNIQIRQKSAPRDLSNQRCPFCDEIPGAASFVGHICHHLEEISYSAIAQENDDSEEETEVWGGSVYSSTPRSPSDTSTGPGQETAGK